MTINALGLGLRLARLIKRIRHRAQIALISLHQHVRPIGDNADEHHLLMVATDTRHRDVQHTTEHTDGEVMYTREMHLNTRRPSLLNGATHNDRHTIAVMDVLSIILHNTANSTGRITHLPHHHHNTETTHRNAADLLVCRDARYRPRTH